MAPTTERLEKRHAAVGDLFPRSVVDPAGFALSAEQIRSFEENGFVKGGSVLDEAQIASLRAGLEAIRSGENPRTGDLYEVDEDYRTAPDRNVFHFLGAWLIDEAFHDVLFHPAITVKVAQLLGVEHVRFWHDQVFYKPPRHPGVVTWHQDYSYWTRSTPAGHVTCWIGLDDSTLENGCLHYVPGSHRWGLLPRISLTRDMDAVKDYLTPEQAAAFRPKPMILKAGECTFHHSHTVHGSYGNQSDVPRRAVVLNFMKPDTRSADGTSPLLAGVPVIPEGQIIEGDFFPLVI
ncbi:MAG TPA: phytanoyl-CoA dioxygenase family protein [Vicinamibacteria bacterium]